MLQDVKAMMQCWGCTGQSLLIAIASLTSESLLVSFGQCDSCLRVSSSKRIPDGRNILKIWPLTLKQLGALRCGLLLDKIVQKHHMIPIALGSGSAGTLQKCRALVRKVLAESHGFDQCCAVLNAVHSITTDFGPEAGVTDMRVPPVMAVESWLHNGNQHEPCDLDVEESTAESPASGGPKRITPNAIFVPGMLHICDNIDAELPNVLTGYTQWLRGFKVLVALLHHAHLRQRLLGTCVAGRCEHFRPILSKGLPALTSWRWGVMVSILDELLPRKGALQVAWTPKLFQTPAAVIQDDADDDDDDDDENGIATDNKIQDVSLGGETIPVKLELLTTTIRSERWWLYAHMLLSLHSYTSTLASWTEGCDCHYWLRSQDSPAAQALEQTRKRLGLPVNTGDGTHRGPCPLAGCRAPALAAGAWKEHMMNIFDAKVEELLTSAGCVSGPDIAAVS